MSLRWLASSVGARFRPGVRRRMAPLAQRDLSSEIDADALTVVRVWARALARQPDPDREPDTLVIARVDPGFRTEVTTWLAEIGHDDADPSVRTDWLLFPAAPEAVLMAAIEGAIDGAINGTDASFRFNLRISADRYRRQLEALAGTGQLGLTTEPLQVGPAHELLSPCRFVPIPTAPLRAFLRELPAPPVV